MDGLYLEPISGELAPDMDDKMATIEQEFKTTPRTGEAPAAPCQSCGPPASLPGVACTGLTRTASRTALGPRAHSGGPRNEQAGPRHL